MDFSLCHIEVDSGAHVAPYSDPKGDFFLEAKQPNMKLTITSICCRL